jgi:hypothetical protein
MVSKAWASSRDRRAEQMVEGHWVCEMANPHCDEVGNRMSSNSTRKRDKGGVEMLKWPTLRADKTVPCRRNVAGDTTKGHRTDHSA